MILGRYRQFAYLLTIAALISAHAEAEDTPRLPVPSPQEQDQARSLIEGLYKSEWQKARTSQQKGELANQFIEKSTQESVPANRYALLTIAERMSSQIGDVETAFKAVEQLSEHFDINHHRAKVDAFIQSAEHASTTDQRRAVANLAPQLMEECVAQDDFDTASQLYKLAVAAARGARERKLAKQLSVRQAEIKEIANEFAGIKAHRDSLEKDPADPDANFALGRFYCLMKGDWDKGLPFLAIGSDTELKKLAWLELSSPAVPSKQIALAEGWQKVVDGHKGVVLSSIQQRAIHWLELALPNVSGLQSDKVKSQLALLKPAEEIEGPSGPPQPVIRKLEKNFVFNNEARVKEDWKLTGNWSIEASGLKFQEPFSIESVHQFQGDFALRFAYAASPGRNIEIHIWNETFRFSPSRGVATIVRKGDVVTFACNSDTPQQLKVKEAFLGAPSSLKVSLSHDPSPGDQRHLLIAGAQIKGTVVEAAKPAE